MKQINAYCPTCGNVCKHEFYPAKSAVHFAYKCAECGGLHYRHDIEMCETHKQHYQDSINKALAMFNRTIATSMPVRLLDDSHYWPVRNMIKDAGLFIHAESACILCVSKAAV